MKFWKRLAAGLLAESISLSDGMFMGLSVPNLNVRAEAVGLNVQF